MVVRAVPGHVTIGTVAAIVVLHEFLCLAAKNPDELITRVFARWRIGYRRYIINAGIIYIAAHLMDVVPYDPLRSSHP